MIILTCPNCSLPGCILIDCSISNFQYFSADGWTKSHTMGGSLDNDFWEGTHNVFVEGTKAQWMWGKEEQGFTTVVCVKDFSKFHSWKQVLVLL